MRKILFLLFALLAIWSCKNEVLDEGIPLQKQATAFVKLADGHTPLAGTVKIVADASNAELAWITTPECNLDTEQTSVLLKNGIGELPVKWLNKQENGQYAPANMAFKAWVRIKVGDKLEYIPLILSEQVDSVKLMQSVRTRAGEKAPKVATLRFSPTQLKLSRNGGTTILVGNEVGTVAIDYTAITEAMRIDKVGLPENVTTQQETLNFKWVDNLAPVEGFTAVVKAYSGTADVWGSLILIYDPSGASDVDLEYVSNNMPATGNLPATSSIYTFTFKGTYEGAVQLRTLSAGKVLYTATVYQYPANQPKVRVPENTGAERPVQFEYRVGTGMWIPIPQANRTQDGAGVTPPEPGAKPTYGPVSPAGDIPDGGGNYNCVFSNYAGKVYFRAVSGEGRLFDTTSAVMAAGGFEQLFLTIPEAVSKKDCQVLFQCSTDSLAWETMETRKQIVETFGSGSFSDMPDVIPVGGGVYHYSSSGTLSAILTIVIQDDDNKILAEIRGAVGGIIEVKVPRNTTGQRRALFFRYKRSDIPDKLYFIQRGDQAGH